MKYKPPSPVLFRSLRIVALPIFKLLFSYKRFVDPRLKDLSGPSLVVANHGNYIDPVFLALALPHYRINFVAGSVLMKKRWTRKIMSFVQVIPKLQFVTDTRAVRSMIEIIKQEGSLALFPEARRSLDGASEPFDIATAKLIKKYKLNVIAVRTSGAYLSWPRWSKAKFKLGPVEARSTVLLTGEETANYSAEELNNILIRALEHNDFNWQDQRKKKARYLSSKRAWGLERLLHRCPHCETDLAMLSHKQTLQCKHCGYEVELASDMLFRSKRKDQPLYFPSIYDWHHWQRRLAATQRYQDQASFSCAARIVELDYGDDPETGLSMLIETGREAKGSVSLSSDLLHFTTHEGTASEVDVRIPLTASAQQVFTDFAYIQMPANAKLYNIYPEEAQNCIRIVDWVESRADEQLDKN